MLSVLTAPRGSWGMVDRLTSEEWEALCDGCGKCCLHKHRGPEGKVVYTGEACAQLDRETNTCRNYSTRFMLETTCIKLTPENVSKFDWLPDTCAYRNLGDADAS